MTAALTYTEITYLPVDNIKPNPYQPRKFIERRSLEELAMSIKRYGVMQPISVRFINGASYELVAGERRLKAAKLAGLETIPAIIVNISDRDSAAIALVENMQRQDLNYYEETEGFNNLVEYYGYTKESLAAVLGKSQSAIEDKVRKNEEMTETITSSIIKTNNHKLKRRISDVRLFTNTIKQSVEIMNESGVSTNYEISENSDYYEINIKITRN